MSNKMYLRNAAYPVCFGVGRLWFRKNELKDRAG